MTYNNIISEYINKVTKDMGLKQRKEVTCELETHILDSADALATKKNAKIDEAIINEVISRMGSAEEVAAMYPKEKAFSDNILDILKGIGIFTVIFIIVSAAVIIVQEIYTKNIKFNTVTILIFITIYVVLLSIHLISKFKIFSKLLK